MEALTVDLTYGMALFEAARDVGKMDEIREELETVDKLFKDEPLFFELVKTPCLTAEKRKESITQVFDGKLSDLALNFLCVLVDKRRIGQFHGIIREFEKQIDENLGVSKGEIYSVSPLTEGQLENFEEETGKLLRKNVKLNNKVDASLIGGIKILIDGKMIDASIRKRLDDLREDLITL